MISFLLLHASTIFAAIACGMAWLKGGPAEREAAVLLAAAWIVSIAAQIFCTRAWLHHAMVAEPYLIAAVDTLVGAGFVILMLRHAARWLGAAVLVQGAALALHAAFLTGDGLNGRTYVAQVNALGGVLLILLLGATLAVWVRRSRSAGGLDLTQSGARLAS